MNRASILSLLGRVPLVGNVLRRATRIYPEGSVVTIKSGRAAGMKWKRHHRYVNGYWVGTHEIPLQESLCRELRPGQTFYDVGANAGFFTLVGSRAIGPAGKCVAFEPVPENAESIREQIAANELTNCQLVPEALSDSVGETTFCFDSAGSSTGHFAELGASGGQLTVRMTTLDEVAKRLGMPDVLKVDVEGVEDLVIAGAASLLKAQRPVWVIELHGRRQAKAVLNSLKQAGYVFFELNGEPYQETLEFTHHVVAKPN